VNKTLLALAATLALSALPTLSQAQESPLSFNVAVVSDYRYRGISQTRLKPALQGGIDYSLPAGFYVGAWASTIKWIKDNGVDGSVELDLYGGIKFEVMKDLTLDLGVLRYEYVGNKLRDTGIYSNANTTELYGAVSYGPVTAKYSHSVTDLFGNIDSKNSKYLELNASFDLGNGWAIAPHLGRQLVKNLSVASYTDYSLALTKDISGFIVGVSLVGTNADESFYVPGPAANSSKFLGKDGVVLSVKKTF
jgi:uncharacterized protein (TIGR02001 family)